MKNQNRQSRDRYNQDRDFSRRDRDENSSYRRQGSSRSGEWYDRDPMDERSGYRDEERDYSSPQRMDSSDIRGYNDHYRYDQMYHNYYGSTGYTPDRDRERERSRSSSYDSDRYSRGQGAYGTSSSGRASWDTGVNSDSNRWSNNDDYNRDSYQSQSYQRSPYGERYMDRNRDDWRNEFNREKDRTSSQTSYGATQGSWGPQEESRSSFYGRGPKNFKRSDERIKEEICEMLTRNSSIDADDIDVDVKEGEVILSGNVTERRMKHLAEDVAEQCFGVKDVVNNIRVKRFNESESSSREGSSSTSGKKSSSSASSTTQNPNH